MKSLYELLKNNLEQSQNMAEPSTGDKVTREGPSKPTDAGLASLQSLLNPIPSATKSLNRAEQPPSHLLEHNDASNKLLPLNMAEVTLRQRTERSQSMVERPSSRTVRALRPSIAPGRSHEAPSYYPRIAQARPPYPPLRPMAPYPTGLGGAPQYYSQTSSSTGSDGYHHPRAQSRYYPAYGGEYAAYYGGYPGQANKVAIYSNSVAIAPLLSPEDGANFAAQSTRPYARSPRLKVVHKMAERRRRFELRSQFNELEQLLPDCNRALRKTEVVNKAIHLIDELVKQREALLGEREELRDELRGVAKDFPES